jgi:hypothetical protein
VTDNRTPRVDKPVLQGAGNLSESFCERVADEQKNAYDRFKQSLRSIRLVIYRLQ